jgi:hypothetical protein
MIKTLSCIHSDQFYWANLKIKKNLFFALLVFLFYRICLDLSFYLVNVQMADYIGFILQVNRFKLLESYCALIFIIVLAMKIYTPVAKLMSILLLTLSYVPLTCLYAMEDNSRNYFYLVTLFWIVTLLLLRIQPTLRLPSIKKEQSVLLLTVLVSAFCGLVLVFVYIYFTFRYNFDIYKIYEIRKSFIEVNAPFSGYFFIWFGNVINPFMFIFAFIRRRWLIAVFSVFLQLVVFSITGCKTLLYALPFIFIVCNIIELRNFRVILVSIITCFILIGTLFNIVSGNEKIAYHFTRRALLVPAKLSFIYYDFFSSNAKTYLAQHKFIENMIKYPYELKPPLLIGKEHFKKLDANATNGIYADAYLNFGPIGFLIWSILLCLLIKFAEGLSKNKDFRLITATLVMPTIALYETSLLTTMFTHGFVVAFLVIYLIPQRRNIA